MPAALVAFVLFLMTGALVPRHRQFRPTPGGVPVYVVSNGFHTDLVMPVQEPQTGHNWLQALHQPQLTARFGGYQYAAFGWGNEGFYLGSMGGRFPGPGAIAGAVLPSKTLMHVNFYRTAPDSGRQVVPLRISPAQYRRLVAYVQQGFRPDSLGQPHLRQPTGYSTHDFFFLGTGRYHALRTCNDWTTRGLRRAGLRAPLKSPLAAPVLFQVRRGARFTTEPR